MPTSATQAQRLLWHLEHQERCGCRPMPAPLRALATVSPHPRCSWVPIDDPLYVRYHDLEWGVPLHDERKLFEMLNLEGAQAGLSWRTVLHKREGYRRAFANFDPQKLARFSARDHARLMNDPGIVRNRLKITATIENAKAWLSLRESGQTLHDVLWRFVDGKTLVNNPRSMADVPSKTPRSDAMSKELRRLGFKFVGSTICYAFMQACGLVDDHMRSCFRHHAQSKARKMPSPSGMASSHQSDPRAK